MSYKGTYLESMGLRLVDMNEPNEWTCRYCGTKFTVRPEPDCPRCGGPSK